MQIIALNCNLFCFMAGALKGVMRVGVLAKGLLLHERLDVNLVVLCHGKNNGAILKLTFGCHLMGL